jgi:hypothetical protein
MTLTPFPEDLSTGRRPKKPKTVQAAPILPAIEEKEADIKIQQFFVEDSSPESTVFSDTAPDKEKYIHLQDPLSPGEPLPERELQLDPFGLPLSPQPLGDPLDPLTWSRWKKIKVLIHISLMSFLSQFLAMSIVSTSNSSYHRNSFLSGICPLAPPYPSACHSSPRLLRYRNVYSISWCFAFPLESSIPPLWTPPPVHHIAHWHFYYRSHLRLFGILLGHHGIPFSQWRLCRDPNRSW